MPTFPEKIPTELRHEILSEFYDGCAERYGKDPASLNVKLPREAIRDSLNKIMRLAEEESLALSRRGELSDFLDANPVPGRMAEHLPREYRAFCLFLNAMKQEIVKTMGATDRALFGKNSRALFRGAAERCAVTGDPLVREEVELHHGARDGRPPIPLGKRGHALIERQNGPNGEGEAVASLRKLRDRRGYSWARMRRGLEAVRDGLSDAESGRVRSVGNACLKETNLSAEELLALFD